MKTESIDWVITGADRVAANGDVANKIGTYTLAVVARAHGVKFMVVAPASTIDFELATGTEIPIEYRDPEELLSYQGQPVAAAGVDAVNPVFDVTPAALIDVLVTDAGALERPDRAGLERIFKAQKKP
jgi:methylthioribose-1-phosphate isomerase